jgi:hypothetical protein
MWKETTTVVKQYSTMQNVEVMRPRSTSLKEGK